jgi:hypothetical protein
VAGQYPPRAAEHCGLHPLHVELHHGDLLADNAVQARHAGFLAYRGGVGLEARLVLG